MAIEKPCNTTGFNSSNSPSKQGSRCPLSTLTAGSLVMSSYGVNYVQDKSISSVAKMFLAEGRSM